LGEREHEKETAQVGYENGIEGGLHGEREEPSAILPKQKNPSGRGREEMLKTCQSGRKERVDYIGH